MAAPAPRKHPPETHHDDADAPGDDGLTIDGLDDEPTLASVCDGFGLDAGRVEKLAQELSRTALRAVLAGEASVAEALAATGVALGSVTCHAEVLDEEAHEVFVEEGLLELSAGVGAALELDITAALDDGEAG